jgi:hypothetical protein
MRPFLKYEKFVIPALFGFVVAIERAFGDSWDRALTMAALATAVGIVVGFGKAFLLGRGYRAR